MEQELEAGRRQQAAIEQLAAEATPRLNEARDTWYRLNAARERLRALGSLAQERGRLLGAVDAEPYSGRDPEQLERQAARVRDELTELERHILDRRSALEAATAAKSEAERAAAAEDKRLTAVLRAAADRREGLAKLAGQVGAARSRVESAQAELGRLRDSLAAGQDRRSKAQSEFTALESQVAGVEEGEETLDADYEDANAELDAVVQEIADLTAAGREAVRERDALVARRDALQLGLNRKDGAAHVLSSGLEGVAGTLAARLAVEPGYETAIAAALGEASEAIVVLNPEVAAAVVKLLKDDDAGRAVLLLESSATAHRNPATADSLPAGARRAVDLVSVDEGQGPVVTALLAASVVVDDFAHASALVTERPDLTAVTTAGDVLTARTVTGGSAKAPSLLEVQAAVDDAETRLAAVTADLERNRFALAGAEARRTKAQSRTGSMTRTPGWRPSLSGWGT